MIPYYSRVAALDDKEDHLQKIVLGLAQAGFCVLPVRYDAGLFVPTLPERCAGIRIVFTDIHMGPELGSTAASHASIIINGLKNLIEGGPYGLIFWSQFPADADNVWNEIVSRTPAAGLSRPIFKGVIDKKEVFAVADHGGEHFDADALRQKILSQVAQFDVLEVAASWDERVAVAASRATNRLYELATANLAPGDGVGVSQEVWADLLTYLAAEAVGKGRAMSAPVGALDNALLPLLEDQLFSLANADDANTTENPLHPITVKLKALAPKALPSKPAIVRAESLNSHYLIEDVTAASAKMWERGMVTELGGEFINSGPFINTFGMDCETLVQSEFLCSGKSLSAEEWTRLKLCVVELSAECDAVQEKIAVHRYLLALLIPDQLYAKFDCGKRFRNDSIKAIGKVELAGKEGSYHLLVSCRRFMSLAPGKAVDGRCAFRLRRSVVDELAHHYATHSRRPGVLRFH